MRNLLDIGCGLVEGRCRVGSRYPMKLHYSLLLQCDPFFLSLGSSFEKWVGLGISVRNAHA